jgi:hypothetical protein
VAEEPGNEGTASTLVAVLSNALLAHTRCSLFWLNLHRRVYVAASESISPSAADSFAACWTRSSKGTSIIP